MAGKTVTLDNNEGHIDCQKPGTVANNSKDQEATLGTNCYLSILFPRRALFSLYTNSETCCAEKTKNTVWEENAEPSNDKTDVQENGWATWKRNPSTSAWSYRALRSSALGPTMAMLRGKNNQRGKPPNRKNGK